eukprot:gene31963-39485_t
MATLLLLKHIGYVLNEDEDEDVSSLDPKNEEFAIKAKLFGTKNDTQYKLKISKLFSDAKDIYASETSSAPRKELKFDMDSFTATLDLPAESKRKEIPYPERIAELLKNRSHAVYKENMRQFIKKIQQKVIKEQKLFASPSGTPARNDSPHSSPVPQRSASHSTAPASASRRIDVNNSAEVAEEVYVSVEKSDEPSVEPSVAPSVTSSAGPKSPLRHRATKYTGRLSVNSDSTRKPPRETSYASPPRGSTTKAVNTEPTHKQSRSRISPNSRDLDDLAREYHGDASDGEDEEGDEHTERLLSNSHSKPKQTASYAPPRVSISGSAAKKRAAEEALVDDGIGDSDVEPDNSDEVPMVAQAGRKRPAGMSNIDQLGAAIANPQVLTKFPAQLDGSAAASKAHKIAKIARGEQRVRNNWTAAEEKELFQSVVDYGEGAWVDILDDPKYKFHKDRTNVHLKDKWRTMVKAGKLVKYDEVARTYEYTPLPVRGQHRQQQQG